MTLKPVSIINIRTKMFTCSKKYSDLPFAHRQHFHQGHCSQIHGHNWGFEFNFAANYLDENGFVVDFGDLKWLKEWLCARFDHTLVLNYDDPHLQFIRLNSLARDEEGNVVKLANIVTVPNCGAEGLAFFVFEEVNKLLAEKTGERVYLISVTVHEDEKNTASFIGESCNCGE